MDAESVRRPGLGGPGRDHGARPLHGLADQPAPGGDAVVCCRHGAAGVDDAGGLIANTPLEFGWQGPGPRSGCFWDAAFSARQNVAPHDTACSNLPSPDALPHRSYTYAYSSRGGAKPDVALKYRACRACQMPDLCPGPCLDPCLDPCPGPWRGRSRPVSKPELPWRRISLRTLPFGTESPKPNQRMGGQ